MVVEDQARALGEVEAAQGEGEEVRRNGRLRKATEGAEGGHRLARLQPRAVGRALHGPRDLAAGDEGKRRLDLVQAPRLQHLGKGDAGGMHVDHYALPGGERM